MTAPAESSRALNLLDQSAPALEQAGAQVAFHTDDWITDSRYFLRMAAFGIRAGMSRQAALAALDHYEGARMLDMGDRVGGASLEPGKDADFVILSGRPVQYLQPNRADLGRRHQTLRPVQRG